jgi:hypothetical protein
MFPIASIVRTGISTLVSVGELAGASASDIHRVTCLRPDAILRAIARVP